MKNRKLLVKARRSSKNLRFGEAIALAKPSASGSRGQRAATISLSIQISVNWSISKRSTAKPNPTRFVNYLRSSSAMH